MEKNSSSTIRWTLFERVRASFMHNYFSPVVSWKHLGVSMTNRMKKLGL